MKTKDTKNTLGYDVARSNWYLKTLFNKCLREAGHPLSQEQWVVLQIVSVNPSISQTELAKRSLRDKTNITRILDGMQKKGFVVRQRDLRDRRIQRIQCTPEGVRVLNAMQPAWSKVEKIYSAGLSQDEVIQLRKLLGKLCHAVREHL